MFVFACSGYAGVVFIRPRIDYDSYAYGVTEWWWWIVWHIVTVNCRFSKWCV